MIEGVQEMHAGAAAFTPVRNTDGVRPKLLFLCQTLPFPPDGGVNIRTYNILRLLTRVFDVTALCFFRKGMRSSEADVQRSVAGLREIVDVEAFPIPQEHSRLRLVVDHAKSVITSRAYTHFAYSSKAFERRLRELLATQRFDLVHVDSLDLTAYLHLLRELPVACTHHNVESSLLKSRSGVESSALKSRYIRHQAQLTEKEESEWCGRFALNIAVSAADANLFNKIAPDARFVVIPNGVDTTYFQPSQPTRGGLVFVGGHEWFPNRDAMEYFVAEILPLLRGTHGDVDVTWVGRCPNAIRDEYERLYNMTVTGYVDDVRPYIQNADCYIVPLRSGGGTRLKILDAWAMGKAVVSTSVGCEGLAAKDGENILIRDDPAGFAAAVRSVLTDESLRSRLGHGARETVLQLYDWEVLAESLIQEYVALLPNVPSVTSFEVV